MGNGRVGATLATLLPQLKEFDVATSSMTAAKMQTTATVFGAVFLLVGIRSR